MSTPIYPLVVGSVVTYTLTAALTTGSFLNTGLRINVSTALLGDFRLPVAGMTAPVAGVLQGILVPRDFSGNSGGSPTSGLLWTPFTFNPLPASGNSSGAFVFSADRVSIDRDCDLWLFNNALGQSIPNSSVLSYQLWTPAT